MGSQEGSDNGGPYEKFGHDAVVLGVETSSGKWQFVLKMQGSPHPAGRTVHSHIRHRGDATREQAHDLQQFAQACFKVNAIDTSNVGALQGSLGRATGCVVTKCERKWGWKPFLSGERSDNGGPYGAHGLGATVVGVETTSGKWQFILRRRARRGIVPLVQYFDQARRAWNTSLGTAFTAVFKAHQD